MRRRDGKLKPKSVILDKLF